MALLIENGTVFDGTGAPLRPDTAVLVDEDRIAAVGDEATEAAGLPSIERIDAAGCTVMPGLIDTHVHVTLGEPSSNDELFFHRTPAYAAILAAWQCQKMLRAGVTSFFDVDGLFDIGPALKDGIDAGIVEGPRMVTGLHALLTAVGGTAGRLIPDEGTRGYARVVRTNDEMIETVRQQVKYGADWIKVHATGLIPGHSGEIQVWTLEEMKVVCDTAHDLGIRVCAHTRNASSARDAARSGVDLIFHGTLMDDEALEAVVDAGTPIAPVMTFLANLIDHGDKVGASPAAMDLFRNELESSAKSLRAAYDAGNLFMCGSETGFSITPVGHWHAKEAELLVRYLDLTPVEALTCATGNGAFVMRGMEDRVGVIEPGRYADLLVVDGDPVADIGVLGDRSRLRHVLKGGARVDLDRPWPERSYAPGEKVGFYGNRDLTWEIVNP